MARIWRKTHRPEEYAADALTWLASETGIPRQLASSLLPLARRVLLSWEPAADEVSVLFENDGEREFKTFFTITNYSDRAVYALMEKTLRAFGIGANRLKQNPETEFAWILLGGVLADYARKAGVRSETTTALLDFRLRNSDYFTATTWHRDSVTIANLRTGCSDSLELPPEDINSIVDFAIRQHCDAGGRADELGCNSPHYEEYIRLDSIYRSMFF